MPRTARRRRPSPPHGSLLVSAAGAARRRRPRPQGAKDQAGGGGGRLHGFTHLPGSGPASSKTRGPLVQIPGSSQACPSCRPAYGPLLMLDPKPGRTPAKAAEPTLRALNPRVLITNLGGGLLDQTWQGDDGNQRRWCSQPPPRAPADDRCHEQACCDEKHHQRQCNSEWITTTAVLGNHLLDRFIDVSRQFFFHCTSVWKRSEELYIVLRSFTTPQFPPARLPQPSANRESRDYERNDQLCGHITPFAPIGAREATLLNSPTTEATKPRQATLLADINADIKGNAHEQSWVGSSIDMIDLA